MAIFANIVSEHIEAIHRDLQLERSLQSKLDRGDSIWVVGDVHGYLETLRALLDKLNLREEDSVVFLGDLIDRGPNSADVLRFVRDDERLLSVRGNHESMMHKAISKGKERHWKSWLKFGGIQTLSSFGTDREDFKDYSHEWVEFLSNMPTEIVLQKYRLVHAGFDPRRTLEEQRDHERLWTRDVFYWDSPVDEDRQILVGHTPVQELSDDRSNSPWMSKHSLRDGRPSIIGLDTGIALPKGDSPTLTAYCLENSEIVQVSRVEP